MYDRKIQWDTSTKDFALYFGRTGEKLELVGFARTFADGEETLDTLEHELLTREYTGSQADEVVTPAA